MTTPVGLTANGKEMVAEVSDMLDLLWRVDALADLSYLEGLGWHHHIEIVSMNLWIVATMVNLNIWHAF